jgi:hypothetical protein
MRRDVRFQADYYVVSLSRNAITDTFDDLEEMARELGVLKPWEELAG